MGKLKEYILSKIEERVSPTEVVEKFFSYGQGVLPPMGKGARGDWKKEGYQILHHITPHEVFENEKNLHIIAHDSNGNKVGHIKFQYGNGGKTLMSESSQVEKDHRRKGLASAMYAYAEKVANAKIIPSDTQTNEAEKLWVQPNRPFGKNIQKARVDEGKSPEDKRSARAERQSSWERENYGMMSGASKNPAISGFIHRAKLHQIRNSPTPKLTKGAKGDWKKEGYTFKFHPPKVEMFNGKHDITAHRVTAHDAQGNRVGDYYFSEWPEASEHKGLLHVTFSGTDPDHQRKGLASAAYSLIEQKTGKKVHSSPGNRSADAKALWAQPNRPFGKSLAKGAARRLYGKFDPVKELGEGHEAMADWVSGNSVGDTGGFSDPRKSIPAATPHAKLRMLNKISNTAKFRRNSKTGEREYLLHRQMSSHELGKFKKENSFKNHETHSSWTTNLENITRRGGIYPKASKEDASYNHIVSAWIPESKIKQYLPQYGRAASETKGNLYSFPIANVRMEQEVVVSPGVNADIHEIHQDTGEHPEEWNWKKVFLKSDSSRPKLLKNLHKSLQKTALPSAPKVNLNPEHGKQLAQFHEQAKHSPNDPSTKKAYNALAQETAKQFQDLVSQGYKFSPMKPGQENPYKTSKDVHADLANNKHLWYFPTDQGYGSGDSNYGDHPLLASSGLKDSTGREMLHNDVFRAVHDVNGHFMGGQSGFGPKGEHQAYLTHKKMYSPEAHPALAAETLLQNSAVNYGKHGEHNRANPHKTIYAEQKAFAAPDWVVNGRWHE